MTNKPKDGSEEWVPVQLDPSHSAGKWYCERFADSPEPNPCYFLPVEPQKVAGLIRVDFDAGTTTLRRMDVRDGVRGVVETTIEQDGTERQEFFPTSGDLWA